MQSDVCSLLEVQSIGGARYFITFANDHSIWSVVHPMSNRSEAFEEYQMYAQLSQSHNGRRIEVLPPDSCCEYMSAEFNSYLIANGTQHELTAVYRP